MTRIADCRSGRHRHQRWTSASGTRSAMPPSSGSSPASDGLRWSARMAQTLGIIVTPEHRADLASVIGDSNSPLKHVQMARIVLLSSERLAVLDGAPAGALF
jgi:hypothetical protein